MSARIGQAGPLTPVVLSYERVMRELAPPSPKPRTGSSTP